MERPRATVLVIEEGSAARVHERAFESPRGRAFSITTASDAAHGLELLRRRHFDIVAFECALPGIRAESLIRQLRSDRRTRDMGIVVLGGKPAPFYMIAALDAGADDYLLKPVIPGVLLARLDTLARRLERADHRRAKAVLDGLELDFEADRLAVGRRRVDLTPKEMDLLKIFVRRPDVLHSAEHLLERAWGREGRRWKRTLVVTLSSLRRKLGPDWGARLKVHRGRGYILET